MDSREEIKQGAQGGTPGENLGETIKLDQFLKLMCVVQTGGEAKMLIQNGDVQVNGEMEVRRGRKLGLGDRVTVFGEDHVVEEAEEAEEAD